MAKKKQTKVKPHIDLGRYEEIVEVSWADISEALNSRHDKDNLIAGVYTSTGGSTVINFADGFIKGLFETPEEFEIEVVSLPKPTLWQRIKSWFRG